MAMVLLVGLAAAQARAQTQSNRIEGCPEEDSHPIDVAGHLSIAARSDLSPLGGVWRWGAVPVGIAVGGDGSVYWAQYRTNTIERADADGKKFSTIATVDGPLGIAVDRARGRLFYVTDRHYPRIIGSVRPGGDPKALICGSRVNRPFAIGLAENSDKLYWTESINGRIRSADTDGAFLDTLYDDGIAIVNERRGAIALSSTGIAVDDQHGFVFWSDLRTAQIIRVRLDGSDRRIILGVDQGLDFPTGLAVDTVAGKLYWGDPGTETISRADLNGLHPEVVAGAADGVLEPYGLAVDTQRRLLYWTDVARNRLYRASLDDKRVEPFIDLDPVARLTPQAAETVDSCGRVEARASQEFLRRWTKSIRTCVIDVTASKAIMRSPYDLKTAAITCDRQLLQMNDTSAFRAALEPHCNTKQVTDAIDDALDLGAEIVAADLPRSAGYLREVRPFVAGTRPADAPHTQKALATLDDLVKRLEPDDREVTSVSRWTLPVSGQTTRYMAITQLADGAAPVPDDGMVRAGAPFAYVDNGDGTISDVNTGLTWEKKCDGCRGLHDVNTAYPWRSLEGERDVRQWLAAINSEDDVGFAGHNDWRLPEVGELLSIVDYEHFNPAVGDAFNDSNCGLDCGSVRAPNCSCTGLGDYWSAGSPEHNDGVIPVARFNLGLVLGQPTAHTAFVRAVRGRIKNRTDRFVDNGDGTITDRVTRLMWEKKCKCEGGLHDADRRMYWSFDGRSETIWDWLVAINAEDGHGFAGHDDWRIPNVKELYSLVDRRYRDPSIDPIFAADECDKLTTVGCSTTSRGMHWTSTTFADFPALAVTVGFGTPMVLEREPPPGIIRIVGGVEPYEKTFRRVTRAVRGPVQATP
jgi:sugar lactone lactonase YvrE